MGPHDRARRMENAGTLLGGMISSDNIMLSKILVLGHKFFLHSSSQHSYGTDYALFFSL